MYGIRKSPNFDLSLCAGHGGFTGLQIWTHLQKENGIGMEGGNYIGKRVVVVEMALGPFHSMALQALGGQGMKISRDPSAALLILRSTGGGRRR